MDRPYCRICDARCRLHFSNWSTKAPNSIKVPKKIHTRTLYSVWEKHISINAHPELASMPFTL